MRHLLIILSFFLLGCVKNQTSPVKNQTSPVKNQTSPLFVPSERPETIIIPVSSLGDVSGVRKQILQNTLTDELKKHFRIVPQEKYEQVLEQVFQELKYEECSEDTCIMRVQEMLQVENVFNLQIIGEGKDSQLNLKWVTLDEKKNETDVCLGCGTFQLNDKVRGLVEKLVGKKPVVLIEPLKVVTKVEKKPIVVVKKRQKGVLFFRSGNDGWVWYEDGDENMDIKYVGEIENGKPNGQGTETFPDGQKYEGEWKNGKYHGQGNLTSSDGRKYVGEFKDGEEWNGTEYDKNRIIIGKYVYGVDNLKEKKAEESRKKKLEELKKLEEDRKLEAEKQKRLKESRLTAKKELTVYWETSSCKPYLFRGLHGGGMDNHFGAEYLMFGRPFGVNKKTGQLVKSYEEATILFENYNLVPRQKPSKLVRFLSITALPMVSIGGASSYTSNTACYETDKKNIVAIKFIKFNKLVMQEEFSKGKGDHLVALYSILGCTHSVQDDLNKLIQMNYGTIYNKSTYPEIEARSIMFEVNKIINSDPWLMGNCNGYSPVNVVATRESEYQGINW